MGGGSSRFDETDWETASGNLTTANDTIDGAAPTPKYGIYYIEKRSALNQRDYDVTDSNANLIYSTRSIEGTLAWFDVLGPGLDDYILRVQVDLSRRYWVIYRFHAPSYPTQFADMVATNRLRQVRGDSQPCLYKKACITVSWSRYHAIVHLYEAPPPEDKVEEEEEDDKQNLLLLSENGPTWVPSSELNMQQLESATAAVLLEETGEAVEEMKEIMPDDSLDDMFVPVVAGVVPYQEGVEETKEPEQLDVLRESPSLLDTVVAPGSEPPRVRSRAQMDPLQSFNDASNMEQQGLDGLDREEVLPHREFSQGDDAGAPNSLSEADTVNKKKNKKSKMKKLKKWVADTSGANDPPPDPLEGYLALDRVILKCEEINSFMGQHQTMLVSDKEAKLLELEELETAANSGADAHNPDANYKHGIPAAAAVDDDDNDGETNRGAITERSASDLSNASSSSKSSFPRMRKLAKWMKTQSQKVSEASTDIATASCNGGRNERLRSAEFFNSEEGELLDPFQKDKRQASSATLDEDGGSIMDEIKKRSALASSYGSIDTDTNGNSALHGMPKVTSQESMETTTSSKTASSSSKQQPLVGFWNWDNTMRVHKMKMHVAEGSDLALHIVLAIVTNQLRYERNVVVSTV